MKQEPKAVKPRILGYPNAEAILPILAAYEDATPDVVYRTCTVKLHNVSRRDEAALLQVFKNVTLAACWMLRDMEQRKPREFFADCRKESNLHYHTQRIQSKIDKQYREKMRGRYQIAASIFESLCAMLASTISAWLYKMAEAEESGALQHYQESAAFIIPIGRHTGKRLGSLRRKTIIGYAKLLPTEADCDQVLRAIEVLLNEQQKESDEYAQAAAYHMTFGPRQHDPLGKMRATTLQRLRAIVERERGRCEIYAELRGVAQTYLSFTPPRFPHIKSDGLSIDRRRVLEQQGLNSLEQFGALPDTLDGVDLTEDERVRFRQLQHDVFAATEVPHYIPIYLSRADGCINSRGLGLAYDAKKRRYVAVLHVLAKSSRYRKQLSVTGTLTDVNNPETRLTSSPRPISGLIFELECGQHQQAILDRAKGEWTDWKERNGKTAGSVCSALLYARYDAQRRQWWFELAIAIRTQPAYSRQPAHIVGVHCDQRTGYHVCVMTPTGEVCEHLHLTEARIASLLGNHPEQAQLLPEQRTRKEQLHRIADAITALCVTYQAAVGIENIAYLGGSRPGSNVRQQGAMNSRGVVELLKYKLPLAYLPNLIDVYGVAFSRDCGACGERNTANACSGTSFTCSVCGYHADRSTNAAREVARRTLWLLEQKGSSKAA